MIEQLNYVIALCKKYSFSIGKSLPSSNVTIGIDIAKKEDDKTVMIKIVKARKFEPNTIYVEYDNTNSFLGEEIK